MVSIKNSIQFYVFKPDLKKTWWIILIAIFTKKLSVLFFTLCYVQLSFIGKAHLGLAFPGVTSQKRNDIYYNHLQFKNKDNG